MLVIIIPAVWLTVALFFVALCRMAARGDADAVLADAHRHEEFGALRVPTQPLPRARLRRLDTAPPCRARTPRRAPAPQRAAHGGRQRP
jgi:hypothetical protein